METWRTIKGYPNYKVSNMGNVKSIRGNILRPFDRAKNGHPLQRGYMTVHLCSKDVKGFDNWTVHSLVMQMFVGPRPDGMVINHKNGIRWDNRLENLEYCTQSYNRKQDFIMGRQSLAGEKNTQSKLTEDEVKQIVELYKTGDYTGKALGRKYGVSVPTISGIVTGRHWSYLTGIKYVQSIKRRKIYTRILR
jgi:hypothetical protein